MVMRFAAFGLLAALTVGTSVHAAENNPSVGIEVVLNNAKVVKLSQPATTVIVGNPEIADATIQDANTIILTGRGFGRTNIVILDGAGTPILDEKIAVSRPGDGTVRVFRRSDIETLSCEPNCEGAYLTEAETQSIAATRRANRAVAAE